MSVFSDRLREERKRLGMTQTEFAALGNVTVDSQGNYERGARKPDSDYLAAVLAEGIDVGYLFTGVRSGEGSALSSDVAQPRTPKRQLSGPAPAPADEADVVLVPLIAAAGSMGPGNDLQTGDVILGNVPVSRNWVALNLPRSRPEALRLVHAYGDSMGETLHSGDFALVDTDCTAADVDGVYVLVANEQLFIKRVTRRIDGQLEVTSDNPNVRTVEVLNGSHQVRICGRVVYGWNGRRF
ncbi:putative phage repressor [Delftia sp. Cs1-4]|uniref:XRE family transcriptional regulator n=1 Tax=Delftia sp. (strain Cs1-4) TaxID=742013 RepID=UPI00020E89ED|nr:S24 family peptidase [Delftia sp. Cs1-4]AEF91378.1 putative phage repressor [Delftia sp. Cs1-4]